jgi:hypothetical protein
MFEQLLTADERAISKLIGPFATRTDAQDAHLSEVARRLNLNSLQLLCGFGFNRRTAVMGSIIRGLGYASFDELCSARNYQFINDLYAQLSISDVLDIYAVMTGNDDPDDGLQDLIYSRLAEIEARVEATSNPVLVGAYKLEIRGIYESGLMGKDFVETRLTSPYAVLRALTNEIDLIATRALVPVESLIARPSVTPEEKRMLLMRGLVPPALILARLGHPRISLHEKNVLDAALQAV